MPPLSTVSRSVGGCSSLCSQVLETCRRVLEGEPAVTQFETADSADPPSGKSNGEGFETGRPSCLQPAREDEEQTRELV